MKLRQKIAGVFLAAVTALSALSVGAFATDPVGTNPTVLKDGVQATEQIKYDKSRDFDNGHNYVDFKYTAPADGTMVLTIDSAINHTLIGVYKDSNKQKVGVASRKNVTGHYGAITIGMGNEGYIWDSNAGIYAGTLYYNVEKGDYIIRVSRDMRNFFEDQYGKEGNGRVHITVEMQKPENPSSVKVGKKTEKSFTLTWTEPEGVDAYDIRYKASGDEKWKTVEDIMDNTATIKGLKGSTKYLYCIRSKAGEIVGDWSKAASVKTSDPKNVKFTAPVVESTITISWKEVKDASGYNVKYSTDNKKWKTESVEGTSYALKVTSGKTYYYAIQAKNSATKGPWSATKSITIG